VNDVHFGETTCGVVDGTDVGPVFSSAPGEEPYPEVMNRAAIAEMAAIEPEAVVVKGDLTANGTVAEYEQFLAAYLPAFADRLHHVRGNHDAYYGATFASEAPLSVELPGVRLAVIDTAIPARATGQVTPSTLEWLDTLAAEPDDRPVLVLGHHHPWSPDYPKRDDTYFGINPDDSERLVELVARRPAIAGYLAGHTHRNRVRRFRATGDVPWVEVACVKDFPGTWAEYRVFEGGILQVHRRIASPEALSWSERTRGMFGGIYGEYAFGELSDRCFPIWPRTS
jgi:3',5'-cyclic-AMP phosphodiesterase